MLRAVICHLFLGDLSPSEKKFFNNLFFAGYSSTEIQRTCKRCQLNVIESDGVYNILVENVRLGVDEYYECQVSPGKGATNSVPLRAPVHITIQGKVENI